MNRFDSIEFDAESNIKHEGFKALFTHLTNSVADQIGDATICTAIIAKLDEAFMLIGRGIREDQIKRTGEVP